MINDNRNLLVFIMVSVKLLSCFRCGDIIFRIIRRFILFYYMK